MSVRGNLVYFIFGIFMIMFLGLLALGIYMFTNPEEAMSFMSQYGQILLGLIFGATLFLIGYSYSWFKALRIYVIDSISGGGDLIGITIDTPVEKNIREVLDPRLPDAGITVIPASKMIGIGRPVLLPVHKERGVGWGEYANIYGYQIKFITFYGRFVTLDEFLASVYGLNISENNPNDLAVLRSLLQKVDKRIAKKYLYFDPYAPPKYVKKALEESATITEGAKICESMRLLKRFYESQIAKLQQMLLDIGRSMKEYNEGISQTIYKQIKSLVESGVVPAKLYSSLLNIPPDKLWRSGAQILIEHPSEHGEIARRTMYEIQRSASAMGLTLVPNELLEELKKRSEASMIPVTGGGTTEIEHKVKKEIKEAEGK